MSEFAGRMGPHVLVREGEQITMLVVGDPRKHHFSVREDTLLLLRQQHPEALVRFYFDYQRPVAELPVAVALQTGALNQRNTAWRRIPSAALRRSTQQELAL